jgi:chorismate--pyruvate lyase
MNQHAPDRSAAALHGSAPWTPWPDAHPRAPRRAVIDLLRCETSLTAALRDHSGDRLGLAVVRQEDSDLHKLQAGTLTAARGVVREVVLSGAGQPWVFAQTLIPLATISAHPWLVRMGEKPLGDALFHHDGVERSDLSFATLGPGTALFERVAALSLRDSADLLWARRSYFYLGQQRLLITEVFLPALCRAP